MQRAAFIGRFQPFHLGHDWLIRCRLNQGHSILVLVRDVPPDDNNPYTTEEAASMIRAAFPNEDVIVQIIPDVSSVNWGRGVGYETTQWTPPENIHNISATEIRRRISTGDNSWRDFVNPHVAEWLVNYYDNRHSKTVNS